LLIRGKPKDIQKCIERFYEKIIIARPSFSSQLSLKLAVPNSSVSMLIGKQGLAVKRVQRLTGCHVSISKRVENIEQRIVTISGKPGQPMISALLSICEKLQTNKHLASHHCFTPCVQLPLGVWECSNLSYLAQVNSKPCSRTPKTSSRPRTN